LPEDVAMTVPIATALAIVLAARLKRIAEPANDRNLDRLQSVLSEMAES
jgi:hypothetical protein